MLVMVLESFKNGEPKPVYARLEKHGRMLPDDLRYISSWVDQDLSRCFQVMECSRDGALQDWMENWRDLVDFELVPVLSSAEAATMVQGKET